MAPTKTVRVLTYNVKMLPTPFGDEEEDVRRAEVVVEQLLAMPASPDVVCLQEVFDEEVRKVFVRGLKAAYPHQVPKCEDTSFLSVDQDSGLFFASRIPFLVRSRKKLHSFREYDATAFGSSDYFTDKGVFGAALDVQDHFGSGHTLCVFQTHLQSDHTWFAAHPEVRARQLAESYYFMNRFLSPLVPATTSALYVGDFNVIAEVLDEQQDLVPTEEYLEFLGGPIHASDLWRDVRGADVGYTWDGVENSRIPTSDEDQQRLDYVLSLGAVPGSASTEPVILRQVECAAIERYRPKVNGFGDLSDHYGVLATVRLRPQV